MYIIQYLHFVGYSKSCIERNITYVEPRRAMDCSVERLRKNKFVIITGDAGSGKTSFCLRLMSKMKNLYPYISAIIITCPSELKILDSTKGYVLFIDDFIGKSDAEITAFDEWRKQFDYMHNLLFVRDVHIIFASRSGILHSIKDDLLNHTLFRTINNINAPVIDLSGEDFKMTIEEKSNMLKMYCNRKGVTLCSSLDDETKIRERSNGTMCLRKELFDSITLIDTPPGFPFLCERFFSEQASLDQGLDFFKVTSACSGVKKQVDRLLLNDQYLHYAVLVSVFQKYTLYRKDGFYVSIDEEDIANIGLVEPREIIPVKIKSCLDGLLRVFLDFSDEKYRLKNLVIYEAVLLSFGENFPQTFLKIISKEVLFTYVRSKRYKLEKHEVIVRVENKMTECLAKKIVECGSSAEIPYFDTYTHPSFRDNELVRHFLNHVERDVVFKTFVNSFVAGVCKEKNDYFGSQTINRFSDIYDFDINVFLIVLTNDLFKTYIQFLNNETFKISFLANLFRETSNNNYLITAFHNNAEKCMMHMLGFF